MANVYTTFEFDLKLGVRRALSLSVFKLDAASAGWSATLSETGRRWVITERWRYPLGVIDIPPQLSATEGDPSVFAAFLDNSTELVMNRCAQ